LLGLAATSSLPKSLFVAYLRTCRVGIDVALRSRCAGGFTRWTPGTSLFDPGYCDQRVSSRLEKHMSIMSARAILEQTTHSDFRLKMKIAGRTVDEEISELKELLYNTRQALVATLDELRTWEKGR